MKNKIICITQKYFEDNLDELIEDIKLNVHHVYNIDDKVCLYSIDNMTVYFNIENSSEK